MNDQNQNPQQPGTGGDTGGAPAWTPPAEPMQAPEQPAPEPTQAPEQPAPEEPASGEQTPPQTGGGTPGM